MSAPVQCTRCRAPLDDSFLNRGQLSPCPACGIPLAVEGFPALWRPIPRGNGGEPLVVEGEASCFYHSQKKAVVACQGCGRFLCGLCDCELSGEHFCPACLETGKQKGKMTKLENQRTLYGNIALALTIYPVALVITIYFLIITAPLAIFLALRHWKAPGSIVGGGHTRHVVAIILGIVELAGWAAMIYFLVREGARNG